MYSAVRSSRGTRAMGLRALTFFGILLGGVACDDESGDVQFSDIEPRVATYSSGAWTVEALPDAKFSTHNAIFARGPSGRPAAIRSEDSTLYVGRWDGDDWVETAAATLDMAPESAQLIAGVAVMNSSERFVSMFATANNSVFVLAELEDHSYKVTEVPNALALCFDLTVAPDGRIFGLYADNLDDVTRSFEIPADGSFIAEQVLDLQSCGSVSVDPVTDQPGAVLWYIGGSSDGMVAQLFEKGAEGWTYRDVATNGYYSCETCLVPQLLYRTDGYAVIAYVDSALTLQISEEQVDGLFKRSALTASGQAVQSTSFQRTDNGDVAMVYTVDSSSVRTAISRPTGLSQAILLETDRAVYPRMVVTSSGIGVSFWGDGNLQSIAPSALASLVADPDTAEGYQLGSYISAWKDETDTQVLQIFYNEVHVLE